MTTKSSWGGARPGCGRKPKSTALVTRDETANVPECPDILQFDGLDARQIQFVMNKARGKSTAEICRAQGLSEKTGDRWAKTAWFKKAFQHAVDRLTSDMECALKPLLGKALAVYENALGANDRHVAQDVMDRLWGKPTQRQEVSRREAIDIRIGVYGMPDSMTQVIHVPRAGGEDLNEEAVDGEVRSLGAPKGEAE